MVVAVVVAMVSIAYLAPRSQVVTIFAGILFGVVICVISGDYPNHPSLVLTRPASLTHHCTAGGNTLGFINASKQFSPCHAVGL